MSLENQQTRVLTQNPPFLGVWIVASFRTFYVADLTNPIQAAAEAAVTANQYAGCTIDSDRNLAFVCDGLNVLYCVDISEPLNPTLLDSLVVGGGGDRSRTSAVRGTLLYVVNEALNEVYIIDTSTPSALVQLNAIDTVTIGTIGQSGPCNVAVRGNNIYVVNYNNNVPPTEPSLLNVIDVSDSLVPVSVGQLSWGVPVNDQVTPPSDRTGSIQLFGNYAYVVVAGILHIVDISDPANPTAVSDTAISATAFRGALDTTGRRMMIVDNTNLPASTVRWWDVSKPAAPVELDSIVNTFPVLTEVTQGPRGAFYVMSGNSGEPTNVIIYTTAGDTLVQTGVTNSIATGGGAAIGARPVADYAKTLKV